MWPREATQQNPQSSPAGRPSPSSTSGARPRWRGAILWGVRGAEIVSTPLKHAKSSPRLPITKFAHKAGVVTNNGVRTSLAARDMATERRRPARLDRRDCSELPKANVPFVGCAPRCSMGAEYVRHLHGLSCLATAAAQGPQTARQELLSGYRALRSGRPIGSDFVP
jgi:hypothetical protein